MDVLVTQEAIHSPLHELLAHTIHDGDFSKYSRRASGADTVTAECFLLYNGTAIENRQYEPDLSQCLIYSHRI